VDNQPKVITSDKNEPSDTPSDKPYDTRIVKIGNTTFEINHFYVGTLTYEEVVRNAIRREAESR